MKKILNAFSKEKLQKVLFLGMIALVFGVFLLSIVLGNSETEKPVDPPIVNNDPNTKDPDSTPEKPEPEKYKAPCDVNNCSIIRQFYSLDDDTATQEMSLIQFGTKYFVSRGLTYNNENDEVFDVMATMSGTVTDVSESSLYGNTITIDHGNDVKSEYLSVSNVLVEIGDTVSQGDVIASSGMAEYDTAASNHVHFRVSINGTYCDPETLFGTSTN